MQSSKKLSTPVSVSSKWKQMENFNTYTLVSAAYVEIAGHCEVVVIMLT